MIRRATDTIIYFVALLLVEKIDTDMSTLRNDDYWKPKSMRRC